MLELMRMVGEQFRKEVYGDNVNEFESETVTRNRIVALLEDIALSLRKQLACDMLVVEATERACMVQREQSKEGENAS